MCYCPTPTLHLNLALTGDGAFLFSPQKTHSVWFISVLNYGDTENVLINHLLLVIPMSYPCHYTNLCPHKPHKHAHTHTHTHTHTHHTHTHSHTHHHTHTPHTHTHRTHARTHARTHTNKIFHEWGAVYFFFWLSMTCMDEVNHSTKYLILRSKKVRFGTTRGRVNADKTFLTLFLTS